MQAAQATQAVQNVNSSQGQGIEAAVQAIQQGTQQAAPSTSGAHQALPQAVQGIKDIHDIKPPVSVGIDPLIFKTAFAVIAIVCLVVACYFLFRYLKKRMNKNRKENIPLLPSPLPADQAALRELGLIADLMLTEPRLYYFRLTALLKIFIGKVFNINAPEMTTQEIISTLNTLAIEREMISGARELFLSSSMIKYAALMPEIENMKSDEKFVKIFIDSVENSIKNSTISINKAHYGSLN